jgi:uncharacterized protein YbjT (DUF2867 family)
VRILVTGASGFIGRHVVAGLRSAGHEVVAAARHVDELPRRFPGIATLRIDFNRDTTVAAWTARLHGIDAVVNAAGILQGGRGQSIEAVHAAAPIALFDACVAAGVTRVVQISAISIGAATAYARTKRAADDHLMTLDLDWTVLRPSLVYADGSYGGTSLMRGLAALPFALPLPGDGSQPFQPIHVEDLVAAVRRALDGNLPRRVVMEPVGPDTLTLRQILERWRGWLGLAPAPVVHVPMTVLRALGRLGDLLGWSPLNSTSIAQLAHGNAAPPEPFTAATGIRPRSMAGHLAAQPSHVQDRWHARLYFLGPLLRATLAATWIGSGIAGLLAPASAATAPLATLGLATGSTIALTAAACLSDLAIGITLALGRARRWIGPIQLALIGTYTAFLSVATPELWLDLYGPLLKNLPIAAAVLVLMVLDDER